MVSFSASVDALQRVINCARLVWTLDGASGPATCDHGGGPLHHGEGLAHAHAPGTVSRGGSALRRCTAALYGRSTGPAAWATRVPSPSRTSGNNRGVRHWQGHRLASKRSTEALLGISWTSELEVWPIQLSAAGERQREPADVGGELDIGGSGRIRLQTPARSR
jgi:hypothetical protein